MYEAKFEIAPDAEMDTARQFGFAFVKEYDGADTYLRTDDDIVLKVKTVGGRNVLSYVEFVDGVFHIRSEEITAARRKTIEQAHPIEVTIHRKQREYTWEQFGVRCSFDSMSMFPERLFLEVHADGLPAVVEAAEHLTRHGLTDRKQMAYNRLLVPRSGMPLRGREQ